MTEANLSLTEAELSVIRDVFEVALDEDDETLREHGQDPAVVDSLGRKVEQAWTLIQDVETCPVCGQPDNCGDCDHTPLTPADEREAGQWIGFQDGREVARYASQAQADLALTRRQVQSIAPAVQPGRVTTPTTALEDLQVALENVARVIDAHGDVDTGQGQDEPHYSLETAVDYLHEAERKLEAGESYPRPATLATFLSLTFDVTGFTEAEVDALTGEALVQGERSDEHPEAPVVEQSLTHKQEG